MTTLDPRIRALFEGPHFAHVATLMADGSPHVAPVWIAIEDERPTFAKASSALATLNLRRDPRVAISINSVEDPYEATYVRGRVAEIREDSEETAEWTRRLSSAYTGTELPVDDQAHSSLVRFVVEIERSDFFFMEALEHTPPGGSSPTPTGTLTSLRNYSKVFPRSTRSPGRPFS